MRDFVAFDGPFLHTKSWFDAALTNITVLQLSWLII